MAMTKKQTQELETQYKNNFRFYTITDSQEIKKELETVIRTTESIMKVLGYNREDFYSLQNSIMDQYNFSLYFKFFKLNQLIDEIEEKHISFSYYDIKRLERIIDTYDWSIKHCSLQDQLYYIKQEIKKSEDMQRQLEQRIKSMIA
jgi:hypothetical protein